jgi:hypothetical protein
MFLITCANFSACNFFWFVHFAFFTDLKSALKFCIKIVLLLLHLGLNLKPNVHETTKKIFHECYIITHSASVSGLGGSIFSKKGKIIVPLYTAILA